jgi:SNF2-related domain
MLHSRPICRCPPFETSRVPNCKCDTTPGVSPLLQIRWKRLVIDEGHVSASMSTNLTPFAQLLSIERRWIVTGTPTTNLLGLSFGQSSEVEVKDDDALDYDAELEPDHDGTSVSTSSSDNVVAVARKWTKYDREDLRKLDNMATQFVGVPHFKAEPGVFHSNVTMALFGHQGSPEPGAIRVLEQVMQSIMIRHRWGACYLILSFCSRRFQNRGRGEGYHLAHYSTGDNSTGP